MNTKPECNRIYPHILCLLLPNSVENIVQRLKTKLVQPKLRQTAHPCVLSVIYLPIVLCECSGGVINSIFYKLLN